MKLPKVKNLRKLLYHATERQKIHLKRKANEIWPWTKDPILQSFRFCATYREDDRVTVWIRENWRAPYADHENLWFAMCIARQINWPDTLHEIGFPEVWKPNEVKKIMHYRSAMKKKVFTSAYLLGGGNNNGKSKIDFVIDDVLDPVWKACQKLPLEYNSLQQTHERLTEFYGWGKFLSYEVVTDLRHTRYLNNAPDILTWANAGPGAIRGLNRLYDRETARTHPQKQMLDEMRAVTSWIAENRDKMLLPTWEMRDTEHLLCEYFKRCRAEERIRESRVTGLERFRPPGLFDAHV